MMAQWSSQQNIVLPTCYFSLAFKKISKQNLGYCFLSQTPLSIPTPPKRKIVSMFFTCGPSIFWLTGLFHLFSAIALIAHCLHACTVMAIFYSLFHFFEEIFQNVDPNCLTFSLKDLLPLADLSTRVFALIDQKVFSTVVFIQYCGKIISWHVFCICCCYCC